MIYTYQQTYIQFPDANVLLVTVLQSIVALWGKSRNGSGNKVRKLLMLRWRCAFAIRFNKTYILDMKQEKAQRQSSQVMYNKDKL